MPYIFYLVNNVLILTSLTYGSREQYTPTDINCIMSNSEDGSIAVNVSWHLSNKAARNIDSLDVSCNCSLSGTFTKRCDIRRLQCSKKLHRTFCYDQCDCYISFTSDYFTLRQLTNRTTCYIGPSAPKDPPVIISPPIRIINSDGNSVQVNFTLPPMKSYCDELNNIKSITVSITQSDNDSYQNTYEQLSRLQNESGNFMYTFKFQAEQFQYWEPFDIAIAVNNSIESTPFSDYMTIKKDKITKEDYTFTSQFNAELSTLNLYWNLSAKANSMLNSHFITGFQFTMKQLGDDDIITSYDMNDTNLTLNISLKSNEWYLLIGRILIAGDEEGYEPEPSYTYFKTPAPAAVPSADNQSSSGIQPEDKESSSSDINNKYSMIFVLISGVFAVIIILLSAYIIRSRIKNSHNSYELQVGDHDDDVDDDDIDDDNTHDDNDDDASSGVHRINPTESVMSSNLRDEPSVVENLF